MGPGPTNSPIWFLRKAVLVLPKSERAGPGLRNPFYFTFDLGLSSGLNMQPNRPPTAIQPFTRTHKASDSHLPLPSTLQKQKPTMARSSSPAMHMNCAYFSWLDFLWQNLSIHV
jgi:hypothetical protein